VNVGHKPSSFGQFIGPKITHLVAAFTANPLTGKAPLIVKFTDKSTGSLGDYLWTFSTTPLLRNSIKITSKDRSPVVRFTNAGIYSVSLKVTNAAGTSTKTISNYISLK
jgi:PKD repeat protein